MRFCSRHVYRGFRLEPVTLKDFDKEDVIIVRSCIPGNEASEMCLLLSKVICSYTCRKCRRGKKGLRIEYH